MSNIEFPDGKICFEFEALGPIRDSTVDFKPFLLFSGESNTGKSYSAMAVYYLFFMLNNEKTIKEFTLNLFDIKKIENDLKTKKMIEIEPPENLSDELENLYNDNNNRFMAYMLGYDDFSCNVKLKLKIPKPDAKIRITQPKGEEWNIDARLKSRFPGFSSGIIGGSVRRSLSDTESTLGYLIHNLCIRWLSCKET